MGSCFFLNFSASQACSYCLKVLFDPGFLGSFKLWFKSLIIISTFTGYQPIIAITKMDELEDDVLRSGLENLLDSGVVESALESFSQLSRFPRPSLFPVINYRGPYDKPDYVVQVLVTNVFKAAVSSALTFLEKNEAEIQSEFATSLPFVPSTPSSPLSLSRSGSTLSSPLSLSSSGSTPSSPLSSNSAEVMDLIEAAQFLKITESEITDLLENKQIKGKKIGQSWRVTKQSLLSFLDE